MSADVSAVVQLLQRSRVVMPTMTLTLLLVCYWMTVGDAAQTHADAGRRTFTGFTKTWLRPDRGQRASTPYHRVEDHRYPHQVSDVFVVLPEAAAVDTVDDGRVAAAVPASTDGSVSGCSRCSQDDGEVSPRRGADRTVDDDDVDLPTLQQLSGHGVGDDLHQYYNIERHLAELSDDSASLSAWDVGRMQREIDEFDIRLNLIEWQNRVLKRSLDVIASGNALNQSRAALATLDSMAAELGQVLGDLSTDDFFIMHGVQCEDRTRGQRC